MLSAKARQLIQEYQNLPFNELANVRCPYFNNATRRRRGELRALVGKGTPREIIEEAKIASLQYHAGLFDKTGNCCLHNEHTGAQLTADDLRHFLIDRGIGIECSGFVSQILRAHYLERNNYDIAKQFRLCPKYKFVRQLLCHLRPIENMSVETYADSCNTTVVGSETRGWNYQQIEPGDVIVLLTIAPFKHRNHIILITDREGARLEYIHARAWKSEGRYGHGVAAGTIQITAPEKNLTAQVWNELGKTGPENETYQEAINARTVEVRRVRIN